MVIKPINNGDWETFHLWAKKENWTISFQEQRLFQNQWRPSFFALWDQGSCCGFISVVIYKTSGWIGNLLVHPAKRGYGYGSRLFDFAMQHLEESQLERIWLTASVQGAPLYRKRGFVKVDQVIRWTGLGAGGDDRQKGPESSASVEELVELDRHCWKESRRPLLSLLADDGIILKQANSIVLLQPSLDFWQIGPWLCKHHDPQEARLLLAETIRRTPAGMTLMTDTIESAGLDLSLRQYGFKPQGQNELMCKSREPVELLSGVNALASLGSIG